MASQNKRVPTTVQSFCIGNTAITPLLEDIQLEKMIQHIL